MSPEQCDGAAQVDAKSDVYSLGIMLYEMLTGEPPFLGNTINAVMLKHATATARPLREANPLAPADLASLVQRMLAKDPTARPTMAQVAEGLEALLAARASGPAPPPANSSDGTGTVPDALAQAAARAQSSSPAASQDAAGAIAEADGDAVPVRTAVPMNSLVSSVGPVPLPKEKAPPGAPTTSRSPLRRIAPILAAVAAAVGIAAAAIVGGGVLKPKRVRIGVQIVGDIGCGHVASDPAGIDCGDLCRSTFPKGKPLHLTATPAAGYVFAGWAGDCFGLEGCDLSARWEQKVEARFTRIAAAPKATAAPAGKPATVRPQRPPRGRGR